MPSRFALATIAAALSISPLTAQIRSAGSGAAGFAISGGSAGAGSSGMASASPGFAGHGMNGPAHFQPHPSGHRAVLLPYPYFYSDWDGGYAPEQFSQPQVVVVPASAPAQPESAPVPRESLLIEWQGDHFVRTTMSAQTSRDGQIAPDYSERAASPPSISGRSVAGRPLLGRSVAEPSEREPNNAVQAPRELLPAVLVFHNGRREEVSEYTIMNGTIYSKSDYWSTGSWNRAIQIADLDVPATLKLNAERGVKFALPSSANEVIIRP